MNRIKARKAIRLAAMFEQIFIACEAPFPAASSAFCSELQEIKPINNETCLCNSYPELVLKLFDPVLLISVSGWNNLDIPRAPGAAITEAEIKWDALTPKLM